MVVRWLLVVGTLGGGMSAAAQLTAQSVPPSPPAAEAPAAKVDDTIVVTTTVRPETIGTSTATIDVIGALEIAARQATTVSQVLATVPGVTMMESGTPGHVTSGFFRGTNSNQTLVLWNGIPLNDPILGGFDFALLPTEGVQQIEVVRGPFSALYGTNAIGGVVNVITHRRTPGGTVGIEGGSYNTYQLRGSGADDIGPTHLFVAGHLRSGDGELANDYFKGDDGVLRADWTIAPNSEVGVLARGNNSAIGIPLEDNAPTLDQNQRWLERQVAAPVNLLVSDWQVQALLSSTTTATHFRNPDDPFFTFSDDHTQELRGRASASDPLGTASWAAAGVEWSEGRASETDSSGPELNHAVLRSEAVFAQFHTAWKRVTLEAGARADDYSMFGSRVSPDVGIAVELAQGIRLHGSYGEGFRAPALGELFFPFFGNTALHPETSQEGEIGLVAERGPFRLDLTAFEDRLRNLIEFDLINDIEFNVGRARTRGVELSLGMHQGSLELRANGTYLDAKDLDTGTALLRRPKQSGNLIGIWRPASAWTLSATERYVGPRLDVDPVTFGNRTNPAYARFDLGTAYSVRSWVEPYLRLENVLGRRYEEVLGYPALGRVVAGGATFHF
jgi:vitamin B12 transporter